MKPFGANITNSFLSDPIRQKLQDIRSDSDRTFTKKNYTRISGHSDRIDLMPTPNVYGFRNRELLMTITGPPLTITDPMGDTENLAAKLEAFMQGMDTRQKALEGQMTELSNSFLGKGKGSVEEYQIQLENLKQKGSVEEYQSQFQQLLTRSSDVTMQQQVHLFMVGLKEEIKVDLELQQPGNLIIAIVLAQALDRKKKMVSQGVVIKLQREKPVSFDQDNATDVEMPLIFYELN